MPVSSVDLERIAELLKLANEQTLSQIEEVLKVATTPAIWHPEAETLRCPHCEWIGIIGRHLQIGTHGCGFRYVEDIGEYRGLSDRDEDDDDAAAIIDATLRIGSDYEHNTEDCGRFARLECRNCLGECALPEGLEIDFV